MPERDDLIDALRREIAAAWQTSDVRQQRPSPLDEVRSGLIVFEQSLWDALPRFVRGVDRALRTSTGRGLPIDAAPIRFGSWIGGDRDGNPHVTPQVTRQACLLSRWAAADLYLQGARRAARRAVARIGDTGTASAAWVTRASRTASCSGRCAHECWPRASGSRRRFGPTRTSRQGPTCMSSRASSPRRSRLCHRSLEETGQGLIAAGRLTDLLRRAAAFGLTLARIDIRQDAAPAHRRARDGDLGAGARILRRLG